MDQVYYTVDARTKNKKIREKRRKNIEKKNILYLQKEYGIFNA